MPAREAVLQRLRNIDPVSRTGRIIRVMPTWIEADGPNVPVGTLCSIPQPYGGPPVLAEIIRADCDRVAMVPYSEVGGIAVGGRVVALGANAQLPVGMRFLGRAIDALANPIDGGTPIVASEHAPLNPDPPKPLERETPSDILETGIRTIDALVPIGRGQRIGIFAASGVGKTSLLSQLLRQVDADVCVCCLVGERGREVEEIWTNELAGDARKRSVLVAATSDQAAALRVKAVHQAVALARYYRDRGLHVFFVLDSMTRFAMALRELGLAAGEPPTLRAYTPSVFAVIPRTVEQAGALKSGGSISAMLTILSETDDVDDPLSELMKSLLDGHIILSRDLAERGVFPAIDPLKSVSRNSHRLMTARHREIAARSLRLLARYEKTRTLVDAALYVSGSNDEIDAAIAAQPELESAMMQSLDDKSALEATLKAFQAALR